MAVFFHRDLEEKANDGKRKGCSTKVPGFYGLEYHIFDDIGHSLPSEAAFDESPCRMTDTVSHVWTPQKFDRMRRKLRRCVR